MKINTSSFAALLAVFLTLSSSACLAQSSNPSPQTSGTANKAGEDEMLKISLTPRRIEVYSGNTVQIAIKITNPGTETAQTVLSIEPRKIPPAWVSTTGGKVEIPSKAEKTVNVTLTIPLEATDQRGYLIVSSKNGKAAKTVNAIIDVLKSTVSLDIVNQSILIAGKKNQLAIRTTTRLERDMEGAIVIEAPSSWTLPRSNKAVLPANGQKEFPITITPDKPGQYEVTCKFKKEGATDGCNYAVTKKYLVLPRKGVGILETDANHDGYPDIIIGNEKVECMATTIAGGRILTLINKQTGNNQLLLQYPQSDTIYSDDDIWVEYGGINDVFGYPKQMPGSIGNNKWDYKILPKEKTNCSFLMSCTTKDGVLVTRKISLAKGSNRIRMDYSFQNNSGKDLVFAWNSHPDFACGGTAEHNVIKCKSQNGETVLKFDAAGGATIRPVDGAVMACNSTNGETVWQRTDLVGTPVYVYQAENYYTVEIQVEKETFKPGAIKSFFVEYELGTPPVAGKE